MIDVLKSWILIECPQCRFTNSVRLSDVSLNRRTICSGCHEYIYLEKEVVKTTVKEKITALEKEVSKVRSYLFDARLVMGRLRLKMLVWRDAFQVYRFAALALRVQSEIEHIEAVLKRTSLSADSKEEQTLNEILKGEQKQ